MDAFCCIHGRIDYVFSQKGNDQHVLVFLHGLGASHAQFLSLSQSLNGPSSTLMVDLPGHGHNIVEEDSQLGFANFSELVISLCDYLDIQNAIFVGISMGSAISLLCASKRSDLVQNLILIRPSWLDAACPTHLSLMDRSGRWQLESGVEQALLKLKEDPEYQDMAEDVPLSAKSVKAVFSRPHALEHAFVLPAIFSDAPFSSLNSLRNLNIPAIVIGNYADSLHPVSIAKATANALPNAELKILPPRYLQPEEHHTALSQLINEKIGVTA